MTQPLMSRATVALLETRLGGHLPLAAIRYRSRTGQRVTVPVQAAGDPCDGLVVAVADPETKSWWRHFRRSTTAEVLVHGRWHRVNGRVLESAEDLAARCRYLERFPGALLESSTRMLAFEPALRLADAAVASA